MDYWISQTHARLDVVEAEIGAMGEHADLAGQDAAEAAQAQIQEIKANLAHLRDVHGEYVRTEALGEDPEATEWVWGPTEGGGR